MRDFLTWLDGKKTFLSAAATLLGVVVIVLLKNLPPALGAGQWIDEGTYSTLLALVLGGGVPVTLMAMRAGVEKSGPNSKSNQPKETP